MKTGSMTIVGIVTLAVLLCGVLFPATAPAKEEKGLIIGVSWLPDSNPPDPAKGWDGWYTNEIGMTETLMALDFDQKLVPKLAESCTNINPATWEIKLRRGITFHDGTHLNARAVKWTFERFRDEKSPVFNKRLQGLLDIKAITVKDDYTVLFETDQPLASFAYKLADPGTGIISTNSGEKGVYGTGPFKFAVLVPAQKFVVERYDGYWGPLAALPRVTYMANKDSQAKMLAFEAGDLDMVSQFPEMDVTRLEKDSRFRIYHRETNRICYFIPQIKEGPLADPAIRRALNYAMDRREIVEVVLAGVGGVAGASVFPAVLPWNNSLLEPYPYDPSTAVELLKKAGVADTDGDGLLDYLGAPLKLRIWTYEGRPSLRPTVELVQAQLQRIGIDSQITVIKSAAACEEAIAQKKADLVLYMANAAPQGDPDYFISTWLGQNTALNLNGYENEELKSLAAQGKTVFDFESRKKIYDRAQEIIYQESPIMVMFYKAKVAASWKHVSNYRIHPAEVYVITTDMAIAK